MKNKRLKLNYTKPYKLGDSLILPDRSLVKRGGANYQLPAKIFKILKVLLDGNGNSVNAGWPRWECREAQFQCVEEYCP